MKQWREVVSCNSPLDSTFRPRVATSGLDSKVARRPQAAATRPYSPSFLLSTASHRWHTSMEDFSHWPAEGIESHEWVMSVSLKTFEGKLWGASQAMVRRSALRSRMGDRKGALQDAQAALGILPERAEVRWAT